MPDRPEHLLYRITCCLLLVLAWAWIGCQSKDTSAQKSEEAPTSPPQFADDTGPSDHVAADVSTHAASTTLDVMPAEPVPLEEVGQRPGAFKTEGGKFALVFQTGMHIEELKAMLDQAEALDKAKVTDKKTQIQEVFDKKVIVQTWTVELPGGPIEEVQLSLFGTLLVSVMTRHRDRDDARILTYRKALGEASTAKQWLGWWDPVNERVVQASVDTLRYEVFDLRAARVVAPKIDQLMGQAWIRRYGEPPAWFK